MENGNEEREEREKEEDGEEEELRFDWSQNIRVSSGYYGRFELHPTTLTNSRPIGREQKLKNSTWTSPWRWADVCAGLGKKILQDHKVRVCE